VVLAFGCQQAPPQVLTISGSAVGREAEVLRRQLERFRQAHPAIAVELRATPDAADLRHQLYVQWLNAHVTDPDVLQLDVVWTAEFAAAGWLAPLERFQPATTEFFRSTIDAHRWRGQLYALPWFVDVGMLYRRTDLAPDPPRDVAALAAMASRGMSTGGVPFGLVWQGARYEGLVTVFLEHLGAFGGSILDTQGRVVVDSDAAVRALTYMRDALAPGAFVPDAVLTWQEEQSRFAFQNGQAVFMRNWPYAYALMADATQSAVAGRVAVSPFPAGEGGAATAALGGSTLAINAYSEQPDTAYQLIDFLLRPEQMVERAEVAGQLPPRPALYQSAALAAALPIPLDEAATIINSAVPRPATPAYSQLSELLQVALHRVLTRQLEPRAALQDAATGMRTVLARLQLTAA
jgi:ABC-type glycerol-3-phosphate transport system substrate-binding protein